MQLADVYGNNIKDPASAGQVSVIAVAVAGTAVPLLLKTRDASAPDSTSSTEAPRTPASGGPLIFAGKMERTGLYSLQVRSPPCACTCIHTLHTSVVAQMMLAMCTPTHAADFRCRTHVRAHNASVSCKSRSARSASVIAGNLALRFAGSAGSWIMVAHTPVPRQVLVGGSSLAKWHLPVSVVPGEADAKHCSIKARGAAGATAHSPVVGQALSCILTTADTHGNLRHSGGASVSPVVIRPDGEETSKAKARSPCDHAAPTGFHDLYFQPPHINGFRPLACACLQPAPSMLWRAGGSVTRPCEEERCVSSCLNRSSLAGKLHAHGKGFGQAHAQHAQHAGDARARPRCGGVHVTPRMVSLPTAAMPMQVKDLTDGRYLISFTPEESGEYVVSALVNGDEIPPDQELQANVLTPPLTVDMCALYVPDQAKVVPAGSSFYVTVGPPETCESKPEDGAKCLVHLQDPKNGITLFPAPWDAQQVAFVADVFVGVVGGNILWATVDVRSICLTACARVACLRVLPVLGSLICGDDWCVSGAGPRGVVPCLDGPSVMISAESSHRASGACIVAHASWRGGCRKRGTFGWWTHCPCMSGSRATR